MKISQKDGILIKNLYLSKRYGVHEGCCMNFPTTVGNLKSSTVC